MKCLQQKGNSKQIAPAVASLLIYKKRKVTETSNLEQSVYVNLNFYVAAYILVESSEVACNDIKTTSECEAAALELRLPDTSVTDDGQNGFGQDPPYCYFENGSLKFNYGGTNTGLCGSNNDKCICIAGIT